ncbi:MAG: hypothetical protein LBD44_04675 [Spirochaetaceae bacterium]|jgi:hypothetical protein|nr:hypothetical protein [Spirochaetaceae bacterium]
MKRVIFAAAVFLAVPCFSAQADKLDEIVSDLKGNRVIHVEALGPIIDILDILNRLALVCTISEKQVIVEPCILAAANVKEFLDGTISSIDAYIELYNSTAVSKNKDNRDSLTYIYKMYPLSAMYHLKQYVETFKSRDFERAMTLAVSYGITF